MRKLLLIRPERSVKREFLASMMPTNLALLAAYVRKFGHEVKIWDFQSMPYDKQEFLDGLDDYKPDIVGFTCYTPNVKLGHELAEVVKEYDNKIMNVVGGPHSTYMTKETLEEFWAFDIAVIGEGEIPLRRICDMGWGGLTPGSSGLLSCAFRHENKIYIERDREIVEDLDEIGNPAYDLMDFNNSKRSMRGFSSDFLEVCELLTSRGCPFTCTFCAAFVSTGRRLRRRSPESTIAEAKYLMDNFGIKHFNIIDDTFTVRKDHVFPIAEGLHKLGATWNCWAHINTLNLEMLTHMKANGCKGLLIGVESGSPRILKKLRKGLTVERIKKGFDMINKVGFNNVEANFIVGSCPDETLEDIDKTRDLIKSINPSLLAVSVICPYPGTPVFDEMRKHDLIYSFDWNNFVTYGRTPLWRTFNFSPEQLVKLQGSLMASFYFNPRYIWLRMKRLSNFNEFMYFFRGGMLFIRDLIKVHFSYAIQFGRDRGVAEPLGLPSEITNAILSAGKTEEGNYDEHILMKEMSKSHRESQKKTHLAQKQSS
jgi:anaerobic magnesium-protoporphyrin IX monomethyl ester cyclase